MSDAEEKNVRVLKLTKPINAHAEQVLELKFREPTGGDIISVGNPVVFDMSSDPPKMAFDAALMAEMMSLLAGVPPSSIAQMSPNDFVSAEFLLLRFFVPAQALA